MFEPTNIAAEIIALTALANSTAPVTPVKTREFQHVSNGYNQVWVAAGPTTAPLSGILVPVGFVFLLTHLSGYFSGDPGLSNTDVSFGNNSFNKTAEVQIGYVATSAQVTFKTSPALWHVYFNRPMLIVIPEQSYLYIVLTMPGPGGGPISLSWDANGYLIPSSRGGIFTGFETRFIEQLGN